MNILYVLIPLLFYIPMFAFETFVAFRRIGKSNAHGGDYLHVTWESTHTFLILSLNYFVWLYSSAVIAVVRETFLSLLIFGASFIIRAAVYIFVFYIRPKTRSILMDRVFAWTHIIMGLSLLYTLFKATSVMLTGNYSATTTYMPYLAPGLIFMIPLVSLPIYFLYRSKS